MRLEDEIKDGRYVVRAEMPGVDPVKDIDITVRDGQLTIKAERSEKKDFDGRSEFSYGSFDPECVAADRRRRTKYRRHLRPRDPHRFGEGSEAKPADRHIEVQSASGQ